MKFDLHYLLSSKYAQWISLALILLFLVLIITECSMLRFSPGTVTPVPETDKTLLVAAKRDSFESILDSSLFGVYVPNDLSESSVKKSMLDVTLVGILFADNINDSQVIIHSAGGVERTYKLGDSIPGDAVIKRIMANGVLVERQGNLESLSLPKNELTFEPVAKPLKEE